MTSQPAIALPDLKALVFDADQVEAALPHITYRRIKVDGKDFIAFPHTADVYRVLRNLGIKLDGQTPFEQRYKPPLVKGIYQPGPHQIASAAFMSTEPRGYVLSTPRTGKTASALMAADFLMQEDEIDQMLVVAPMSVLRAVWEDEAFGLLPHRSVAVLKGGKATRLELLSRDFAIYVINPDGVKIIADALLKKVQERRTFMVIDESSDYANAGTARWKTIKPIVRAARYCHLLNGTPGNPMQVYGQAKLCTPHTVPESIMTWQNMTMIKVGRFQWITRRAHEEHVKTALHPAIRFDKKDIMPWLPKVQTLSREVEMSKEQHDLYLKLKHSYIVKASDLSITAANAAVMIGKLVQIACGAVITDDGSVRDLDVTERFNELLRIIAETDRKVVVFAPFKAVLRRLSALLHPHMTNAIVDGDVTGNRRDAIFRAFAHDKEPHVLLAHPRTVSFGLELAVADTVVFWGPPLNGPFVYQQASERIQSAQQTSATPALVHLYSSYAERHLFDNISRGVALNARIVELFRTIVREARD